MKPLDCQETHYQTVGGKKSNSINAPLGFAVGVAFVFIFAVLTLSIYNWRQNEVQKKLLNEITELMAEQEKTNRYLLKELENKTLTALEKIGNELMVQQEETNRYLLKELENKTLMALEKKGLELMAEQEKTNRYLLKELENKTLTALEKKGHELMTEQEETNRYLLEELENNTLMELEKKGHVLMAEQEKTNRYLLNELENKMLTALEKKSHSVSHLNAFTSSSGVVHGAAWPTTFVMMCAAVWFLRV